MSEEERNKFLEELGCIITGVASSEAVVSMVLKSIEGLIDAAQDDVLKVKYIELRAALLLARDRMKAETEGLESLADILPRACNEIIARSEARARVKTYENEMKRGKEYGNN